jgi:methylmalonyl-CoA decarboxylase
MIARAMDALEEIEQEDGIRALVLTGTGEEAFSAGFDIDYYSEDPPDEGEDVEELSLSDFVDQVRHFDFPTIAMINGGTYGGAMHLIAACDLRVAVNDATFGITPAKLGLIYNATAIYEVMIHVGPANVKEMLFTADFIDAERAYDMGFLNHVVERDELEERTYEIAESIAGNAPVSLVGMKDIVRALIEQGAPTEAERQWAQKLRQEAVESRDHKEGVEAFSEGREPEFEGY